MSAASDIVIPAPERLGSTRLPDGRRLAWSEWGPETGRPVLLFPGAATSRHLGLTAGALSGLDVRLMSIDRPGLGGSDPHPGRTLGTWADDVAAFVALRELGRPAGVAFSQGAPFGLACAAAGVLSALAVVSGTDELAAPEVRPALVPDVARLVELGGADPAAAAAVFAQLATTDAMWQMVLGMSGPADRAVYEEASFAAAYRQAMEEAFVQGPEGYATDTLLSMRPWPFAADAIDVPVHLWYGALDTSPVHAPDAGARLHRAVPGSRHTVLADEGGALLWTRGREVLTALLQAAPAT
ncbi:alpha/beta fold hydrolase [Blastococcus sp. SYSU D00820]